MADQEDQQKILQQEVEENVDQYSYSGGDQYESDSNNLKFDIVKLEKNPFRPIGIDFQKYSKQPIQHLIQKKFNKKKKIKRKLRLISCINKKCRKQSKIKKNQKSRLRKNQIRKRRKNFKIYKNNHQNYKLIKEDNLQIIYPWQVLHDDTWKKIYYYNPVTKESVWELPLDIVQKLSDYRRQFEHRLQDYYERNFYFYQNNIQQDKENSYFKKDKKSC